MSFEQRRAFNNSLHDLLQRNGEGLINADLGRKDDLFIWIITVQNSDNSIITVQAPLSSNIKDPYSQDVLFDIFDRLNRRPKNNIYRLSTIGY